MAVRGLYLLHSFSSRNGHNFICSNLRRYGCFITKAPRILMGCVCSSVHSFHTLCTSISLIRGNIISKAGIVRTIFRGSTTLCMVANQSSFSLELPWSAWPSMDNRINIFSSMEIMVQVVKANTSWVVVQSCTSLMWFMSPSTIFRESNVIPVPCTALAKCWES